MKNIALDIGGTNFRIAKVDNAFDILSINKIESITGNKTDFLNQIKSNIKEIIGNDNDISSISIAIPGIVNNEGNVKKLVNLNIDEIDLKKELEKEFNLPVYVTNDATAAALGEANLGYGKNKESVYFITVSTGIGGAYVFNHKAINIGDEIGHKLIFYKNAYYEAEKLISGTGIINLAKLNGLTIKKACELFTLVKEKNSLATSILSDWIELFVDFIKFINNTFEISIFVLTGGVMKSSKFFLKSLKKNVKNVTIKQCKLKDDAGLYGAAYIGLKGN